MSAVMLDRHAYWTVVGLLLGLAMVMVTIWFTFLLWLFRRLRNRHKSTYEAIGSPSLWWNNSPRNNWLLLRFMFSSRASGLGDPAIARAVHVMRIVWVCGSLFWVCVVVALLQPRTR
jgi:hypothetical protein